MVWPECPVGFIESGVSCYRVVTDNLPWSVAALRCQGLHPTAHLVAIGNDLEQSSIDDIISQHLDSNKTFLFFFFIIFVLTYVILCDSAHVTIIVSSFFRVFFCFRFS